MQTLIPFICCLSLFFYLFFQEVHLKKQEEEKKSEIFNFLKYWTLGYTVLEAEYAKNHQKILKILF